MLQVPRQPYSLFPQGLSPVPGRKNKRVLNVEVLNQPSARNCRESDKLEEVPVSQELTAEGVILMQYQATNKRSHRGSWYLQITEAVQTFTHTPNTQLFPVPPKLHSFLISKKVSLWSPPTPPN